MDKFKLLARNALFKLDAETAHGLAIGGLKFSHATGLLPGHSNRQYPELAVKIAGLEFPNPVGIAAGFDKNGEVPDALLKVGFGFAEVGTVTPNGQSGNPRPRIFRLVDERAIINRLGFNNRGHSVVIDNLRSRKREDVSNGIVGINIGANKNSADFIIDYELGIRKFWDLANYFTINISSPNTPGLRDLQADKSLGELLGRIDSIRDEMIAGTDKSPPLFLKIAPDLNEENLIGISDNIRSSSIDGLVVCNTTVSRSALAIQNTESGGLSGRPLFNQSTIVLAKMRQLVGPDLPIIGAGGIDSVQSAWEKLEAGASLLQLYTGMVYQGLGIAKTICRGLSERLAASQYSTINELTGTRSREWAEKDLPLQ